ncbi:thioredoxin domain-containing protein, partial [Streptomyces sp. SID625]|nr:thioredoxin domain-containing protein [Streptomyces sp. SID625]
MRALADRGGELRHVQPCSTFFPRSSSRCPGCATFEHELHATINKFQDEGKLRVDYHILSFVDRIVSGKGSKYAANALAAAKNTGKFREYHDAPYASPPPSEKEDTFGDEQAQDPRRPSGSRGRPPGRWGRPASRHPWRPRARRPAGRPRPGRTTTATATTATRVA